MMIKSKPCTVDGCENPRFAKGFCKFHQNLRTDKKPIKKRAKAIKKVSDKQERSNRSVKLAKLRVMQDFIQEHGRVWCSSCGTNQGRIDFSHAVPVSDNKKLEGEHEIIFPQCADCHHQTEYGLKGMKDFINFEEIMAAIKKHDRDYYRKLIIRLNS